VKIVVRNNAHIAVEDSWYS